MDPDAALSQARALIEQTNNTDNPFHADALRVEALENYIAMDEWLSKHGYYPKDWQ